MKKEENLRKQRLLLQSEKSPRCIVKSRKDDQNHLQLVKIYTKTVYNKYNRLLDSLYSKSKNIQLKPLNNHNLKDICKLDTKEQEQTKPLIRVRKFQPKRTKKPQGISQLRQEDSKSIQTHKFQNTLGALQNIYRTQNISPYQKIEPKGITTRSTYYGIQLSEKNPEVLLQNIKRMIKLDDSFETIEDLLRQIHLE